MCQCKDLTSPALPNLEYHVIVYESVLGVGRVLNIRLLWNLTVVLTCFVAVMKLLKKIPLGWGRVYYGSLFWGTGYQGREVMVART